ncbi:hypothetical protein C1646_776840 [Rhizophagus diaphanus]|nr:hypothetical protein C1646_776840 [Rhizophagus diaphanus] [Rhizophagus sp. MUCL 43196]
MSSITLGEIGKDSEVLLRVRLIKRIGHHSAVTNVKKNSRISSGIIISEGEFDRVRRINTFNQKRSRGSGYITPIPSTRDVKHELRSSERQLSQKRRSELPPVSSLTTNDEMDISDIEQLVGQRRTSTHKELSLSLYPPPSYDIATAQESSNVRGNIQ